MPRAWSPTSTARLATVHPLLRTLFDRVLTRQDLPHDLTILCGHRGQAEQQAAYMARTSKHRWPYSKHNKLPALAVDIAPYPIDWTDVQRWRDVDPIVKDEWAKMSGEGLVPAGVTLRWGGAWRSIVDLPHYELEGIL